EPGADPSASVWGDGAGAGAGPAPAAESLPPAGQPSADAAQVRQLILESLAAGQTREAIETYLRDTMGFVEPAALVDAAMGSVG
ncbi:MAG: hypothetical protein JWM86_1947, partial [Thermoleophilia bacterium]|nr:hypothetical protein [Thermoleophilia bacterium]